MWFALTWQFHLEVHLTLLLLEGQECNLSQCIYTIPAVMGIYSDTNVKANTKPQAYFIYNCTQTLQNFSCTEERHVPSMRATNQQRMTAWEPLLEKASLPYHCISQHKSWLSEASLWYMYGSGHQECNTYLTDMMYVHSAVCTVHAN